MMVAKAHAEEEMRVFSGGYVIKSRMIIGFLELSGLIWGILGVIGAWGNKERYVQLYNYYQMARVLVWFWMYTTDLPVLWDCEMYKLDVTGAIQKHGWNPVMYKIAILDRCIAERQQFIIYSTSALFFFIYLTWINRQYQLQLSSAPKYLLQIPKGTSIGAFYTQSLGEREHLLGKNPVGPAIGAPASKAPAGMEALQTSPTTIHAPPSSGQ